MTIVLFSRHGQPVGRVDVPDRRREPAPVVVTWLGRTFTLENGSMLRAGVHRYWEVAPLALEEFELQRA